MNEILTEVDMYILPYQKDVIKDAANPGPEEQIVYGEALYLSEFLGDGGAIDNRNIAFAYTDANTGYSVYDVLGGE